MSMSKTIVGVSLATIAALAWGAGASRADQLDALDPAAIPLLSAIETPLSAAPAPEMEQVTSVSQLTDVKPTDWAFQALQSLVERYGCIAGYPDKTYRGNRALTRYEFAAGLNACLDRVNELIAAATADLVKKDDLATVQKLQEEFAAELATLRGRVDALEARTTTLEKQQFSTTTKLSAQIWFNVTGAFSSGDVTAERSLANPNNVNAAPARVGGIPTRVQREQPNTTFSNYLFLTLNTSFTGKDALVTQLVAGNAISPANQYVSAGFFNSWGTPITDQTGVPVAGSNALYIRELSYTFPVTKDIRVAVGPRLNIYRYFDGNRFTNFLTGANSFNSSGSTLFSAVDRGSGAVVAWNITPKLKFTAAYLGENTEFLNSATGFNTSSNPATGLFGGTNMVVGELAFSPSKTFNLKLLYTHSNLRANAAGLVGGAVGEPLPYGFADDGFGGGLNNALADAFVINFDWLIAPKFGVFGRYSFGSTDISPLNPLRTKGEINVQALQLGLGFPDLGKKGALGVISFLMPHDYTSGRRFLRSGGGDGATQYELEASYYYPLNKNIAIVPSFYAIFNPNSFGNNPTVFVGNLRTQFTF
jgi:Carbohydrate-selective porin, OprB family/S-layer homology domain